MFGFPLTFIGAKRPKQFIFFPKNWKNIYNTPAIEVSTWRNFLDHEPTWDVRACRYQLRQRHNVILLRHFRTGSHSRTCEHSFTYRKASIHGQGDMFFGSTGHRKRKQHILGYWVILKRKLGFRERVLGIQKSMRIFHLNEENCFVMLTMRKLTRNYLLSKGRFQSTDFKSRANTHGTNK